MRESVVEYAAWLARHGSGMDSSGELRTLKRDEIELCLVETWEVYTIDQDFEPAQEGYEVNAWFQHDWKPLTSQDVERALQILTWSREDLLESVRGLDRETLDASHPGERWSINGILNHLGGAEWWYLDRLGLAFPREQVPIEPLDRLRVVRAHLEGVLPSLVGSDKVLGVDGEFWSPRKMVRRAVWHERDHTQHILKLIPEKRAG
jgi:hypothetical protein